MEALPVTDETFPSSRRLGPLIPRRFYYYNSPDGEDLLEKIGSLLETWGKVGLAVGYLQACADHIPTKPINYWKAAGTIVHYSKPFIICPTVFAIATYAYTRQFGNESYKNYMVGGFLGGSYVGLWSRSTFWGIYGGLIGATAAITVRYMKENNYKLIGDYVPGVFETQSLRSLKSMDFSLVKEYPRSWYTAEEVREKGLVLPKGSVNFEH